ncbi:MAG: SDR family NAD(P)-dependent oxidoreductase, partial [Thermotogota bacterium]|nr:SDR family NAD(P)-dependent oxidoreductase [Thermotogota bacterium]
MGNTSKRNALITGASAGIGKAFATVFAKNHFDLILTARREDRLRALSKELKKKYNTQSIIIPSDLSDPSAPQALH